MANEKLKCKCGNAVEVKYICGLGNGILELSKNPFAGHMPAYYIECKKCGENLCIRLKMATAQHRDKCKKELIEAWNRRAEDNPEVKGED